MNKNNRSRRFASATIAADELTAVTRVIQFKYDDGKTNIHWLVGDSVDPAVYVIIPKPFQS